MQPLPATTDTGTELCAAVLLDGAPQLAWYVRRHMRRHRKGLSIPQFRALFKIQKQPDASLSCVAEHLGSSLPTTSRIIANLAAKGFITRGYSLEDRRQMILSLTPRGSEIIDSARKASLERIEAECAALSAEERAVVIQAFKILTPFVAAIQQSAAAAPPAEPAAPVFRGRKKPAVALV